MLSKLMSVVTIRHDASESLLSVIQTISEKHYSCALICEYDKPIGIITERDIVRLFANHGLKEGVTAGDVMSRDPVCVNGGTTILEALDLCESRNLRHLPVIDNTYRLIGVVTQTDLVKAHVANYQKSDSLKDQNRKLHMLSIEDPLTGLPNRRAMEIDIKHAAALSKRQSQPYSIALIDIDYFKRYNDSYGHQAGDEALIFIADKLRNNLRSSDKIFRYGGEEFLFLMPMTPLAGAEIATQRICDTIAHEKYPHETSDLGFLSVSIGFASSFSGNWELVVEQADLALYDAKADGRNRIFSAEPPSESEFWDFNRKIDEGQPSIN
ncbi:MAG: diguanylate cyclase (GGDEF)-like protein [Pseudohongiellaceae bacterium]|jgi:diguanylate cyclase (GGDEF)-like protein